MCHLKRIHINKLLWSFLLTNQTCISNRNTIAKWLLSWTSWKSDRIGSLWLKIDSSYLITYQSVSKLFDNGSTLIRAQLTKVLKQLFFISSPETFDTRKILVSQKIIAFILQKLNTMIDLCLNAKPFAFNCNRQRLRKIHIANTPQNMLLIAATVAFKSNRFYV